VPRTAPSWPDARLHVVTGKGGTGKSTVAAALAVALATGGRHTLLVEVEGRQGIASLFDVPPLPYEERRIAVAPRSGEVRALAVDAEEALLDYLELFYNLRRAGGALKRLGAVDFATTIAPGMRDVLLIGKVKEATTRVEGGRHAYDAVVLDAPPTGRIVRFLSVTAEVSGLTRVGPIARQSEGVTALLRSPQTAVHLVSVLEDMPVQETVDAAGDLAAAGLPVGAVIVNMVRPRLLPAGPVPADLVAAGLGRAGLPTDDATVRGLVAEAADHVKAAAGEQRLRRELTRLGRPMLDLPFLTDGIDVAAIHELAGRLLEQGVTAG